MKEERLLRLLGEVEDTFIEEATPETRRNVKLIIFKTMAAVACLCLVIYTGLKLFNSNSQPKPAINEMYDFCYKIADSERGLIKINTDMMSLGAGFSGVMFFEDSELLEYVGESELTATNAPVYKITNYSEMIRENIYLDEGSVKKLAEHVAHLLGETNINVTGEYAYSSDYSEKVCYQAKAFSENYKIYVDADGSITIDFNEPLQLINKSFFADEKTSDEEAMATLKNLEEKYSALVEFEAPGYVYKMEYYKGDYFFDGTRQEGYDRNYIIYDEVSGHNGYFKNSIEFIPDEDGKLSSIRIDFPLAGKEYLGDYPIISMEEAKNMLLNQNYISNVPTEYLKDGKIYEEAVKAVSLDYRSDEYTLPYYCFYVELDYAFNGAEGLKNYGMFYVPAIEEQYLEYVELYDGSFN